MSLSNISTLRTVHIEHHHYSNINRSLPQHNLTLPNLIRTPSKHNLNRKKPQFTTTNPIPFLHHSHSSRNTHLLREHKPFLSVVLNEAFPALVRTAAYHFRFAYLPTVSIFREYFSFNFENPLSPSSVRKFGVCPKTSDRIFLFKLIY